MRTIVWTLVAGTMLIAMAVHALEISSRQSARQDTPADVEIQPGSIDNGDHGGMQPTRYAR